MAIRNPLKGNHLANQIFSICLLSGLIIASVSGTLLGKIDHVMNDEFAKDNHYRLEQIRDVLENNHFGRFEQLFMGSVWSEYTSADIQYLLNSDKQVSMYRILRLNHALQNTADGNPELFNITLYFPNGEYVVDKNHYYSEPQHSPDYPFIEKLSTIQRNLWFSRTAFDLNGNQVELLTYVYALPVTAWSSSNVQGYMFVDIDTKTLMNEIRKNLNSPEEKLFVFQANGDLLLHSSEFTEEDDQLFTSFKSQQESYRYYGSHDDVISFLRDSSKGWQYGLVRKKNTLLLVTRKLSDDVIHISSFVLAASLIVSALIAYRLDRPTRKLLESIRGLFQPEDAKTPYESRKFIRLKKYLDSKQYVDLILGLNTSDYRLFDTKGCRYLVIAIEMEEDHVRVFESYLELLQLPVSWVCGILSTHEIAVVLIRGEDQEPFELNRLCDRLREVNAYCSTDYALGIGTWVSGPEALHESYLQARQALRYSFVLGRRMPIPFEQISKRQDMLEKRSTESLEMVVKSGNQERVEQYLDDLLADIRKKPIHIDAVDLAVVQEVTSFSKMIFEMDMQHMFSYPDMMKAYKKKTLEETITWLKGLCCRITLEMRSRSSHHHYHLMTELRQYIDHHLHEDISLEMLAEKASLSPSYVSSLFKEMLQVSFSNYLNQARLKEAAQLLLADRGIKIAEISEQVGYRNVQYFITKFKGQYGMTPVQYRNTQPFAPQDAPV